MATEVVMPKLGLTMESGSVAAWLLSEGDQVERGQALLEVETDKVTMEVEAQASGVLRRILVPQGVEVGVGTPIAFIAGAEEDLPEVTPPSEVAPPSEEPATAGGAAPVSKGPTTRATATAAAAGTAPGRRHRASPKARRMAREHGVELGGLQGSGEGGRIVAADVEAAMEGAPSQMVSPARAPAAPATSGRVRQVVAERLTASYQQAPHIHLTTDIDASWMALVRRGMADRGTPVTYTDLVVRACALSLGQVPEVNALYEDGEARACSAACIGIAVDSPNGLVVPVLRETPDLDLAALAVETSRLVQGARTGSLGLDEYAGGTFTVTNLGMFGVRSFTAILNPPQVGILAVGAVEDRVVPVASGEGAAPTLGLRPCMTVTLGLDHRAVDGVAGARFLQHLRRVLESPGLLG